MPPKLKVKGKRTYAVVAGWIVYSILKRKGIIVPEEVLGSAIDVSIDFVFGLGAVFFRWRANK